jgi:Flp pilus assembly protein TadG
VIEVALMAPWVFLLFMGVMDAGFFLHALINVENAARVAVRHTSSDVSLVADPGGVACQFVLAELGSLPLPGATRPTSCSALPVIVSASAVPSLDGEAAPVQGAQVSVTVQTLPLVPIPGLVGQLTITRVATARVREPVI